jgi:DNA-directed RNA polymerase subunit RPC12/RpoP
VKFSSFDDARTRRRESLMAEKRPDAKGDERGIRCRYCGWRHTRAVYTRPHWGGRIMRRRQCRHCGKRVTTWEKARG